MKTYRPDSYSKQARRIGDAYMEWEDFNRAWMNFIGDGRSSLIENRVAKRMKRKGFQPTEYITFEEKLWQEIEGWREITE